VTCRDLVAVRQIIRSSVRCRIPSCGVFQPLDAYLLASVAADLRISEVVDTPN